MLKKLTRFFVLLIILYSSAVMAEAKDNAASAAEESQEKQPSEIDEIIEKVVDEEKAAEKVVEEAKEEVKKPEATAISSLIASDGEIRVDGILLNKDVLSEIYSARDHKTIWFNGEEPNKRYENALKFIALADENGLSRQDFNIELIEKRVDEETGKKYIARTDMLITHMVTELIRRVGNARPISAKLKIQTYFEKPVRVKNIAGAFEKFLKADDEEEFSELIEKYSPKHPQYLALRKALKEYIKEAGDNRDITPVPYSRDIVPGTSDHTISQIRDKLGLRRGIDPKFDADLYDKTMVLKVKEFQEKFKQDPKGIINKEFIDELNSRDIDAISRIKANMERYRWLTDDLEPMRIEVNLAEFKVHAYDDNEEAFTMGVIAGREEHKTPIMSTKMYQFIINPYWNVPKGYFLRNMLPMLKQDPNYVKNQNFDLMRMEKEGWKIIEQSSVNWSSINKDNYNFLLRQRPGNLNVLGPIKFAIVNPYDIYLHSTSEPWLFTNKYRGYSSGCIRVEDPVEFAKFLIEKGEVAVKEEDFLKLLKAYESKEGIALPQKKEYNDKYFKFKKPIPTYTTYFTTIVKENGAVEFLDDVYNLDLDQSRVLGF